MDKVLGLLLRIILAKVRLRASRVFPGVSPQVTHLVTLASHLII